MMYADRYARPEGIKPGSLTIAIAVNAALIGALLFSSPELVAKLPIKTLTVENVFRDPPPDPLPPKAKAQPLQKQVAPPRERIETTTSIGDPPDTGYVLPPLPPLPPLPGTGTAGTVIDPPAPAPVLTGAVFDQRYARDLQPDYPAGERRAEREGVVKLRVTIDADGRVSAAECVAAASDAFCRATRAQALAKWRFRPATRDGAAVRAVQTLTVRFTLES